MDDQQAEAARLFGRPIVMHFGGMAECTLLLPMLDAIAKRWGRPVNVLTRGAWAHPILDLSRSVGEAIVLKDRRWPRPQTGFRAARAWLADGRHSPIFALDDARTSVDLRRRSGCQPLQVASPSVFPQASLQELLDAYLALANSAFPTLPVRPGPGAPARGLAGATSAADGPTDAVLVVAEHSYRNDERRRPTDAAWGRLLERLLATKQIHHVRFVGPEAILRQARLGPAPQGKIIEPMAPPGPVAELIAICTQHRRVVSADLAVALLAKNLGCQVLLVPLAQKPESACRGPDGAGRQAPGQPAKFAQSGVEGASPWVC